jgi:hypothetical protein
LESAYFLNPKPWFLFRYAALAALKPLICKLSMLRYRGRAKGNRIRASPCFLSLELLQPLPLAEKVRAPQKRLHPPNSKELTVRLISFRKKSADSHQQLASATDVRRRSRSAIAPKRIELVPN